MTRAVLAVFPASFDPVTNGHLDIATRASRLFDELVLAVYDAPAKNVLFSPEERVDLVRASMAHLPNVRAELFSGLMVRYAQGIGASVVVRGLRSPADFDAEQQQATANRLMAPEIDTVFMMSDSKYAFVSSTLMKQIAHLGGDVTSFVPPSVAARLRARE